MYFIEEGTVVIKMDQDGAEIEISKLGKGAYFGELALVTHRPRAASVYAASDDVKVACKYIDLLRSAIILLNMPTIHSYIHTYIHIVVVLFSLKFYFTHIYTYINVSINNMFSFFIFSFVHF